MLFMYLSRLKSCGKVGFLFRKIQIHITPTQFFLANFELEFFYLPAKLSCIYFFWKLHFVVKYAPFHQNLKTFNTFLQLLYGRSKIKRVNIVISLLEMNTYFAEKRDRTFSYYGSCVLTLRPKPDQK